MKITFALVALSVTVLLSAFESQAQLGTIATAHYFLTNGFHATTDPSMQVAFGYAPTNTTIFTELTLHTNDVGSVFSINQFSDTNFIGFLSGVTNGIDDNVMESLAIGSVTGTQAIYRGPRLERSFFTSFPHGGNGFDLSGFQVQSIDLTVNSLVINSPGSNPVGDGNWTDFSIDVTLSFVGVVPGPTPPVLGKLSYSGAPGQFQFTLTGEANATYIILSSTNLVDWLPVATNSSSLAVRQITNSVSGSRTFFRVRLGP